MKQGQTIAGKYRVSHVLGTGGMATVWAATNIFTERQFAIKFLLPHVARTADAGRRFLLEAKVSARINHPNIIEVIDVGQGEDGALFLVMELLNGMSLEEAMRGARAAMPVRDFLVIMRDVASALAAAHRAGVIHRDLKPSNIFLQKDRDGRATAKVLDFGVSKIADGYGDASLTVVGTILGSPLYMSPEQALGSEGVDQRTDIFAFGAILFEGLCGERPYSATNLNALIVAIATTQPRNIDEHAPLLSAELRSLVRDCLLTDKAERIASMESVLERLNASLDGIGESDMRLPGRKSSQTPSDSSLCQVSPPPDASAQSSRRTTSVSPHSLPTPDAPPTQWFAAPASPMTWLPQTKRRRGARGVGVVGVVGVGVVGIVAVFAAMNPEFVRARFGELGAIHPSAAPSLEPLPREPEAALATSSASAVPAATPIDDLPRSARPSSPVKHNGSLSVTSMPTWCALSVDGVLRGLTPAGSFELSAGTHKIDCVPPNGRPKSATVTVLEGGEAHYQFAFSE